ncbi:MAG: ferrous iron transport protein B [Clostridiales bacterium]|nr:ferrous iron transport protein B [Clostridiales bacterium]
MIFALVGNQNCGKTTLFNQLTGSSQHVGNFPGVTVDRKMGEIRGQKNCVVVDLPGIYSLRPYSAEEILTRDFVLGEKTDAIINIVDATNLERNLYLTLQLIEMHVPMVMALNMMDEVRSSGGSIDTKRLSQRLGVPVVPISASRGEGIEDLVEAAMSIARTKTPPQVYDFCQPGPMHRCLHAVTHVIEDHAERQGMFPRWAALNIIEGNEDIVERLDINENERELAEHSVLEMEREGGLDRYAAVANMRYTYIEAVSLETVRHCGESKGARTSRRIDNVLTNKYAAIPIFLCIMLVIFWLTFNVIGAALQELLSRGITAVIAAADAGLRAYGLNPVARSLLVDGVFTGVGNVLSFLPLIVVLFFFLSMLEDTGYMARVAFVMDMLLRRIGLSGKSIVPMLIGFGCTVPAVMSTRTLTSDRDRKLTILLTPFMSCSAKIPIYTLFSAALFPGRAALVMSGLYVGGILVGVLYALLCGKLMFRGKPIPFVMELPNYRLPTLRNTVMLMWEKAKDFLKRAFTVIFVASVIVWFLQTFDAHLNVVTDNGNSLLAWAGRLIAPVFAPLGFDDWRAATALITGFMAKEAVASTLSVLLGGAPLSGIFTPLTAVCFLTFTLLYTPCVAAIAAIRRELESTTATVCVVAAQCAVAWLVAALVYAVGGAL